MSKYLSREVLFLNALSFTHGHLRDILLLYIEVHKRLDWREGGSNSALFVFPPVNHIGKRSFFDFSFCAKNSEAHKTQPLSVPVLYLSVIGQGIRVYSIKTIFLCTIRILNRFG